MEKKNKVRTCGNCINCVKVNPTCTSYSTYKCNRFILWYKDR